jgi:hypothetical protein
LLSEVERFVVKVWIEFRRWQSKVTEEMTRKDKAVIRKLYV